MYLNVSAIEIRNAQIRVKFDRFNSVLFYQRIKPLVNRLVLFQNVIVDENLKTKYLLLLQLGLIGVIR